MKTRLTIFTAALIVAGASSSFGCSACGCSLSSDWAALGFASQPGTEASIRFEYFNQDDLRSGSHSVNRSEFTFPNDNEIQQQTLNRNTWLDLSYAIDSTWSITASIPHFVRFHTTIAGGDTDVSTSQASGLGDARILVRYQKPSGDQSFGIQCGLKLPTGGFHQNFSEGPQTGEPLDRGLQLGTGTTDLLLGISWVSRPRTELGVFSQLQLTQPLAAREGFIPSASVSFNAGVRWLNTSRFTPQLQLNIKTESREHGANADTPNSGGTLAYLSPGVTTELSSQASAFAFIQLPVFQRVNGLQLEPKWLLSIGMRWKF